MVSLTAHRCGIGQLTLGSGHHTPQFQRTCFGEDRPSHDSSLLVRLTQYAGQAQIAKKIFPVSEPILASHVVWPVTQD